MTSVTMGKVLAHGYRGIHYVLGDDSDELSPALYQQLTCHFDLAELVGLDPDQPDNWHKPCKPDNRQTRQSSTLATDFGLW